MTKTRTRAGALLSGLAALALGVSGIAGVAPEALTPAAQAADQHLIDSSQTATLTFHKYETPYSSDDSCQVNANGGEELPSSCLSGNSPLAGVTFTATRVLNTDGSEIDLTTNAGWAAAQSYMSADGVTTAEEHLSTAAGDIHTTDPTGTDGVTSLSGLPLGVYYVQETEAPAGTTKAEPFVIVLPMTNKTDDGWNYSVNAYPKNSVDKITKTVADAGTNTAENASTDGTDGSQTTLAYTLLSSISALTAAERGSYTVKDPLDSRLTFNQGESTVEIVTGSAAPYTSVATLAEGTDYTWAYDTGTNTVTMSMTTEGMTKMKTQKDANTTAQVRTTIAADVKTENTADGVDPAVTTGVITNAATLVPNSSPEVAEITSNTVDSRYGDVTVTKTSADNNGAALAGATFAVYRGTTSTTANDSGACPSSQITDANKIGETPATGADGTVTFKGLDASNYYNGETQTTLQHYCLVETKAPSGYQLKAEPIVFDVSSADSTTLAAAAASVVDQPDNLLNKLPSTGGMGMALIIIIGGAVIGGAIWASRRNKRA